MLEKIYKLGKVNNKHSYNLYLKIQHFIKNIKNGV